MASTAAFLPERAITEAGEARRTSCGVILSDGERLLLGHATRSPRWDVPKGEALPGESFAAAAARELLEETGLAVDPVALSPLGVARYRRGKDLALFAWRVEKLPEPKRLFCSSTFLTEKGEALPEFDRFGLYSWEEARARVGRGLAERLLSVERAFRSGASG